MSYENTIIDLEYSVEQGYWHYNYGNDPEMPDWFTVAKGVRLPLASEFCDIVDKRYKRKSLTKQKVLDLFSAFQSGKQI